MATVTKAATTYNYTYAGIGNGELLSNQTPAANYAYTYGRNSAIGKPVIEQVHRGADTAFMENDAMGTPVMIRTSAGQQALYGYDAQGSPVALLTSGNTTAFAYSFDPYGAADLTQTTGGNGDPQTPFLYTGGLNDRTTGFTLNGARYYNGTEGRWTQNDTLDAPLDPLNANRYAYAGCNPINHVDPTGRDIFNEIAGGLAGFVVGTVCEVGTLGIATIGCGFVAVGVGILVTDGLNNLEFGQTPTAGW